MSDAVVAAISTGATLIGGFAGMFVKDWLDARREARAYSRTLGDEERAYGRTLREKRREALIQAYVDMDGLMNQYVKAQGSVPEEYGEKLSFALAQVRLLGSQDVVAAVEPLTLAVGIWVNAVNTKATLDGPGNAFRQARDVFEAAARAHIKALEKGD